MKGSRKRVVIAGLTAICCLVGLGGLSPVAAGEQRAPRATVQIVEFTFKPGRTVIAAGSTVTISNNSKYTHTATHPGVFDTGHIPPGKSATVRFERKGVYAFHCELHKFMTGKIVVE